MTKVRGPQGSTSAFERQTQGSQSFAGVGAVGWRLLSGGVFCGVRSESVIAKQTQRHEFPDKKKALQSYSHDLRSRRWIWRTQPAGCAIRAKLGNRTSLDGGEPLSTAWPEVGSRYV